MDLKDVISAVRKFDVEAIYNTFVGLPPQHQTMVLGGAVVALLMILILPITIVAGRLGSMEEEIAKAQAQIDTIVSDIQTYDGLQKQLATIERQYQSQSAESLLTVVQRITEEVGVTTERSSEKGRESLELYEEEKAGFHVRGISLEQLVNLLHKMESSAQRMMRVKELIIAPVYGNRAQLNAEFKEVAAYRLVTEEK